MKTNLPNIDHLTYPELMELLSAVKRRESQLYPEWSRQEHSRYQQERARREEKKKDFNKNVLPKIIHYVKCLLKAGDYIKVSGTRDGKGIRKLLSVGRYTVECRQVLIRSIFRNKGETKQEVLGQITEHQFDKITHVKVGDKWERIKDLIR